jgi:hypothetical protein
VRHQGLVLEPDRRLVHRRADEGLYAMKRGAWP